MKLKWPVSFNATPTGEKDLRARLKANPSDARLWLGLARSLSQRGDPGALKAWRRAASLGELEGDDLACLCEALLDALRLDEAVAAATKLFAGAASRHRQMLRERLINILAAAEVPTTEIVGLLEILTRDSLQEGRLWELLARAREGLGDKSGALAAWLEADRLQPGANIGPRLAVPLREAGDIEGLRELFARYPTDTNVLAALGRLLSQEEAFEEAFPLLEQAVAKSPANINLQGDFDRAAHALRRGPPSLKIAVVGNCQAVGIGQALRRILPQADVVHYHRRFRENPQKVVDALAQKDLILSQPALDLEFDIEKVARGRIIAFPRFIFAGFHPDLLVNMRVFPRQHSRIVAAAFRLGVPEAWVPDLFNAYVYGVLGYFDAYAIAEQLLLMNDTGLGLEGLLPKWQGQVFVHVPDHPVAQVLHDLAEAACRSIGIATVRAEPGPDWQLLGPSWPVYPELAKRIGVSGSLSFNHDRSHPAQALDELVRISYSAYRTTAAAVPLHPQVAKVAEILSCEGV